MDETDVLNQQQEGAAAANFSSVVEQYYQPLYQFAFSLTGSEADAADLVQQTLYTWRIKGGQLRDTSKLKAWLFTTLHRGFLQIKRRQTRFPHYELDLVDSELPPVAADPASHLDAGEALAALSKLDELFRAPLALFYLDELPYNEIAAALKVPLGTVKSRIARGMIQLKAALGQGLAGRDAPAQGHWA